jgi:hypothetical protein
MGLQAAAVATSIAGLTVTGVTMCDISAIPEGVNPRDCPIIYPKPDGFLSGLSVEINSTGTGTSAKKTVRYTLTYMFVYAPIQSERGLFALYPDMVAKALVFIDAVLANDSITGCVDIFPQDIMNWGPVTDPAGVAFHGAEIAFRVTEFVN